MIVVTQEASDEWTATDGPDVVGRMRALVKPDRRCALLPSDITDDSAYGPLLDAAARDATVDLYFEADEDATDLIGTLAERGFAVQRRDHLYLVPTDQSHRPRAVPPGFAVVSAADADIDRHRELDDVLRQDVPGSGGWHNEPEEFERRTFGDPQFDPATYLIAVAEDTGEYVALVRVWNRPRVPRLGMVAALREYRRRGLVSGLVNRAFAVCHARGQIEASTDVDVTNTASNTLMAGLGARRTGGTFELRRPGSVRGH